VRYIRQVAEPEVVLAFLRAERHSGLTGWCIEEQLGNSWGLLETPNLSDARENARRAAALERCRGYPNVNYIFRGFPTDIEWWDVALSVAEVGLLLYGKGEWRNVTEQFGRRLADAAPHAELETESFPHIEAIEQRLRNGEVMEPIIFAAPTRAGDHVLVEGWKRATAYVRTLAPDADVEALAGYSSSIPAWPYY
jgi:hypothetical protein